MSGFAPPIEDYALIGDCRSAALVSRAGSIDWLCWPRFDSAACFAALLGTEAHGCWRIAPAESVISVRRRYRPGTVILETEFETASGSVVLIDFMPPGAASSSVVRIVRGLRGRVAMRFFLALRFDYGRTIPWMTRLPDGSGWQAMAGADLVVLRTPVELRGEAMTSVAEFSVAMDDEIPFFLSHGASHLPVPPDENPFAAQLACERFWVAWCDHGTYRGPYAEAVQRSALTLKALSYAPTGGMVAAPTTSLPERLGGGRNWDYRYCWLRDGAFALQALTRAGFLAEAASWRAWLQRSVAGSAADLLVMYGVASERQLVEWEASWLPGYQGARPVRIGNAAAEQVQLDVFGEVMEALGATPASWDLQREIVGQLAKIWRRPDAGIWEMRAEKKHFVHSKVMAWVAMDRAIQRAETFFGAAPLDEWKEMRGAIHAEVCAQGFDAGKQSFVQSYGSGTLDASLLLIPLVGFLPADDPRVRGTVAAIERELMEDGLLVRYRGADGLPPGEGAFLACSFWLADNFVLQGRYAEARALFERLLALRNDVGLLAEEYDPKARRLVGNFPQAFSHVGLINTAINLGD